MGPPLIVDLDPLRLQPCGPSQQHCPQGACAPLRMGLDMCPWMVIAPQMGLSQDKEPRADLAVRRLKVPSAPVGVEVYGFPMAPGSVEVCGDSVTLWVWFVGFP